LGWIGGACRGSKEDGFWLGIRAKVGVRNWAWVAVKGLGWGLGNIKIGLGLDG